MDKKRKDGYFAGVLFLIIFGVFTPTAISVGWNTSGQIFAVFAAVFGVLGFGSILKPDTVGAVALQILENMSRNEEAESGSQENVQKHSNGSVQVNATKGAYVNLNTPTPQEIRKHNATVGGKTFCCLNGHPIPVYQPDDNHTIASREKEYADQNSSGTVIPITYTCNACDAKLTLYWYQQKLGGSTTIHRY